MESLTCRWLVSCAHLTSLTLIFWMCSTLCDPYLNLFRGIIPPLNGTIDLSPILAFIALDVSPYPETCLACAAVAELCMAYKKTFMHAHRVFCLTYHCNQPLLACCNDKIIGGPDKPYLILSATYHNDLYRHELHLQSSIFRHQMTLSNTFHGQCSCFPARLQHSLQKLEQMASSCSRLLLHPLLLRQDLLYPGDAAWLLSAAGGSSRSRSPLRND